VVDTIRRVLGHTGAVDEATRSVAIVASTTAEVEGESILSWNLERFQQNPVILWAHDDKANPLGFARDPVFVDGELRMRVFFYSAEANPEAEAKLQMIRESGQMRVSVGFCGGIVDFDKRTRKNAELLEVSFVNIPADPGAGTRTDATEEYRFDVSRLGRVTRTGVGGVRVPANLTRTGVLEYRRPDGGIRRELRRPSEVFNADSLASLEGVPVVDADAHTALVTPETYSKVQRGHVSNVRQDGKFVASDLHVNDADMIGKIDRNERHEISAGYVCKMVNVPGEYEGEHYDAEQTCIRYNHVALLPRNAGRAGREVSLRLDSAIHTEEVMKVVIKLDGKDVEVERGCEQHIAFLEASNATLQANFDAKKREAEEADKAAKEKEAAAEEEKSKRAAELKEARESAKKLMKSRVKLISKAMRALFEDDDEDEKEEKADALDDLSDREIQVKIIEKLEPAFKADGKDDLYVAAYCDAVLARPKPTSPRDVVRKLRDAAPASEEDTRADADDAVPAWRKPLTVSAGPTAVRK
jgi:hypothetical protein